MKPQFEKITVTETSYPEDPQFDLGRRGLVGLILVNRSLSVVVEYSFDGANTHGELTLSGSDEAAVTLDQIPIAGVWFKVASGSALVSARAWSQVL